MMHMNESFASGTIHGTKVKPTNKATYTILSQTGFARLAVTLVAIDRHSSNRAFNINLVKSNLFGKSDDVGVIFNDKNAIRTTNGAEATRPFMVSASKRNEK